MQTIRTPLYLPNRKKQYHLSTTGRAPVTHLKMWQDVASLNKIAITFLQTGQYDKAISFFTKAIHLMQRWTDAEGDIIQVQFDDAYLDIFSFSEVSATYCHSICPSEDADNPFEIYTHAFIIDDTQIVAPSVIVSALYFNLGLVYHQLGKTKSQNSSNNLRAAIRCYETGLVIIRRNARAGYASNGMYWLSLALLSNAGNILWSFWEVKDAVHCRRRIDKLLNGEEIFNLPDRDVEFFLDNICCTDSFCRNLAPAA